jgi:hypothetical protein
LTSVVILSCRLSGASDAKAAAVDENEEQDDADEQDEEKMKTSDEVR